jgi:hypothetical protein
MKVRLNLSTKPLETHRRFLGTAGVIGAVAALFFLGLGWHVYSVRKADETFRVKVAMVRQEMAGLEDRSAFLNTLIDQQSLNWTQMFMDLENIMPAGVRLISIEPRHDKGRVEVKLIVGAMNDETKLKFLHALENSHSFSNVELLTEKNSIGGPGSIDRLEVELKAVYARI